MRHVVCVPRCPVCPWVSCGTRGVHEMVCVLYVCHYSVDTELSLCVLCSISVVPETRCNYLTSDSKIGLF